MLRITDVLLRNLIFDVVEKDDDKKRVGCKFGTFVNIAPTCGVSFYVLTPKGSTELEWTSLSGSEKVKLLKLFTRLTC